MNQIFEELTENNTQGKQKDFKYSFTAQTTDEAVLAFETAAQRLTEINSWNKWAEKISADFFLTNEEGIEVLREPKQGDFIKIDIPGPGTEAGEGFDWVIIESVILNNINDHQKSFGFRVRPSSHPRHREAGTAHFLTEQASSSFIVSLDNKTVYAEIHGRNEIPNIKSGTITDKIRNTAVAAGAIFGIADIQWNLLAQGLLK